MHRSLAPVLAALLLDGGEVLVEYDAVLAASATKRSPRARPIKVNPASRVSSMLQAVKLERENRIGRRMRDGLDHNVAGEPPGGVEFLSCAGTRFRTSSRDLVDRVVVVDASM